MLPLVGTGILLLLLVLGGLWISFGIGVAGIAGLLPSMPFPALILLIGRIAYDTPANFLLIAVPLFILLSELLSSGGLTDQLYKGTSGLMERLRGGLLQESIVLCTIFSALTGSATACAAAIGRLSYPELCIKRKYDRSLSAGVIAAGGTLGPLIPPSIMMIVYGSMAGVSIGKLFMSGIFPGLMLAGLFMLYTGIYCTVRPKAAPREAEYKSLRRSFKDLVRVLPIMALIVAMLGSIYTGLATPTEAAAIGVAVALILIAAYRNFKPKLVWAGVLKGVSISAMVLLIIIAATVMVRVLAMYNVPILMQEFAAGIGSPLLLYTIVIVIYLILGMFFDGISMLVITLPFILPALTSLGFDPLWFGPVIIILIGIACLTPPVGLNLFVLQGVTGVPLHQVVKGSLPYLIIMLGSLYILYAFPQIVLWLPSRMG